MADELKSIHNVPSDEPWTMTLPAGDWLSMLSMANYWRTESTSILVNPETCERINHNDVFERFYIQGGLLPDKPDAFVVGSTRHKEAHKNCVEACGEACTKYRPPAKKRGRKPKTA